MFPEHLHLAAYEHNVRQNMAYMRGRYAHGHQGHPRPRHTGRIYGYNGRYPRHALEVAKHQLRTVVDNMDTVIWKRIRMKCGIFENMERDAFGPSWGQASTNFSHAELYEGNITDVAPVAADTNGESDIMTNNNPVEENTDPIFIIVEGTSEPAKMKGSNRTVTAEKRGNDTSNSNKVETINVSSTSDINLNPEPIVIEDDAIHFIDRRRSSTSSSSAAHYISDSPNSVDDLNVIEIE